MNNGIRGNLVEPFDAIGYNRVRFNATMWQWYPFASTGHVWVHGAVYLKDGVRTHATRTEEALVALKDLSPANSAAIYEALATKWFEDINEITNRRADWAHYFTTNCQTAASDLLRLRVAKMADKLGGQS